MHALQENPVRPAILIIRIMDRCPIRFRDL